MHEIGCGTEENNEDNEDKEDLYVSHINIFGVKEVVAATTISEL